jgi:hypothetical protein
VTDGGADPSGTGRKGKDRGGAQARGGRRGAAGGGVQEGERRRKTGEGRWAAVHTGKNGRLGEAGRCGRRKGMRR